MISIIVLVHNGLSHVRTLLDNRQTDDVETEWIIYDNGSDRATAAYLKSLQGQRNLRLFRSDKNLFFVRGNNEAAKHAKGDLLLLLNSDIKINDPSWLSRLLHIHKRGITGLGVTPPPITTDGFCFLIDRDLFGDGLDAQRFEWWWGITDIQARLLRQGYSVQGVQRYPQISHFGGGSGRIPAGLKGMDISRQTVTSWFEGLPPINIIDSL